MTRLRTAVVIVSYHAGPLLERAAEAVFASVFRPLEVIVADNDSRDGALERVVERFGERLRVLRLPSNRGFAGAVNAAIDWRERLVLEPKIDIYALVNQDCFVDPGWLGPLVTVLAADPTVAVAGGMLCNADSRTIEHAGAMVRPNGLTAHRGRGSPVIGEYEYPVEVDYVTGAMCAFRASTWRLLGGFDDGYFPAYFEETDFCLRAREVGMRIVYEPAASGIHLEATTMGRGTDTFLRVYHRNRIRFVARHLLVRGRWRKAVATELAWLAAGGGRKCKRILTAAYAGLPRELWAAKRERSRRGRRP